MDEVTRYDLPVIVQDPKAKALTDLHCIKSAMQIDVEQSTELYGKRLEHIYHILLRAIATLERE